MKHRYCSMLLLAVAFDAHAQTTFTDSGTGTGEVRVSGDGTTVAGINGSGGFRWTRSGGVMALDFLPEDLSVDGSVIAGNTAAIAPQVIRWTQAGGAVNVGNGQAHAVSADGETIVGTLGAGSPVGASRWSATGGLTNSPLTPLLQIGCTNHSISNNGFVAGYCTGNSYRTANSTATLIDARTVGGRMSADGNYILGHEGANAILWNVTTSINAIPPASGYTDIDAINLSAQEA